MQRAFLDDAEPAAVSHAVRQVLDRDGRALVSEHVSSRVKFQLRPSTASWARAGYVGIYQHVGEKEVEVRLALRARWPSRILGGVAIADVAIVLLTFLLNPPGTTWFLLSVITGLALLVAGLLYLNTLRSVRTEERDLMERFEAELMAESVAPAVETDEQRALAEVEAALEGEVTMRRVAAERKATSKPAREPRESRLKMPKFSLRRK